MIEISTRTAKIIDRLFSAKDGEAARRLLQTECAENIPLVHFPSPEKFERIRFAALRLSKGDLGKLKEMVLLAQQDWRDLLLAGDFAHSTEAHDEWADKVIGST